MSNTSFSQEVLSWRKQLAREQSQMFNPQAAHAEDDLRWMEEEDYRLPYQRDVDRILHSKAYLRYEDKTQVIYLLDHDHITHRSLHVQLVSGFSRGIGRILRLNLDLIEAIALGHDVGHPPFGHEGEGYLSALSIEYGQGPFSHPWQSCRLFSELEPIDLGLLVYDGFLCHDGGLTNPEIRPQIGKTWQDHQRELEQKRKNPDCSIVPASLEGCLVKICDTISYLARDIEDAISFGILSRTDLPEPFTAKGQQEILQFFARDILKHSLNENGIFLSETGFLNLQKLRTFNFESIYFYPRLKKESAKIQKGYHLLFEFLLEDYEKRREQSHVFQNFLHNKSLEYRQQTPILRVIIDYISGMTDGYFLRTLKNLLIPQPILWF